MGCEALNLPFSNCTSRNGATQRSSERPPCMDNNYSLNELSNCIYSNGTESEYCVQVGFSQNAFICQCKDYSDPTCGTFLEVHMPNGSPYQSEDSVIAEVRIEQYNVSGVYTTGK